MQVDMNLSAAQMDAIERIFNWYDNHIGNISNHTIKGNVWKGLMSAGIITYDHDSGKVTMTDYGIKSYIVTSITKYNYDNVSMIQHALKNYERLFNS